MTPSRERWIVPDAAAAGATLVCCLLVLALGMQLQSGVHINHDVGWIAHTAAWLLDGRRFGTDILDPNPPLAWFLMLPAVLAARAGILPEVIAVQAWSWLLAVTALALAWAILQPLARVLGRLETCSFMLAATAVVSLLPVGNFGQREVIGFALMLPYLCSLIGRAGGAPSGRALAIAAGIGAGIGLCLKPYLLVVPLLAELLIALQARNFRALIRAETVAMGLVGALYVAAILLFARDYLEYALPMIQTVYWAYDDPGYLIGARFKEAILPAAYAAGIALATLSFGRIHGLLAAWIAGFAASYWLQGKGFPYHAYPILGTSCLLLTFATVRAGRSLWTSAWLSRPALRQLALAALLVVALPELYRPFAEAGRWYDAARREQGDWGRTRQGLIDRLRSEGVGPGDYLYALSTHPHPGFPTVNYLGADWSGRTVAQFAVPAYVRRAEIADPERLAGIDRAMDRQRAIVIEDLRRHPPSFVMVEARQRRLGLSFRKFDDLAYYLRDPEFARLWACYVEIEPVDPIRLFRRQGGCNAR